MCTNLARCLFALLSLSLALPCPAQTPPPKVETPAGKAAITVAPSGTAFSAIQAAVDAAIPGQVIEVRSGTYRENIKIGKPLTLRGLDTGTGKPLVDAGGHDSAFTISADNVTLEGFRAFNSGVKFGDAGILVLSSSNTIRENAASKNHTGIMLQQCGSNMLTKNDASENRNDGICLVGALHNMITANTANANKHAGIWLIGRHQKGPLLPASHNTVQGNMANNNLTFGIALNTGADDNVVRENGLSGNRDAGILLNCGPSRNAVARNRSIKNTKNGILLTMAGPQNRITENQVQNNESGIVVLSSNGSTFTHNQVSRNQSYGIRLDRMDPTQPPTIMCILSQNNLLDNKTNAFDTSGKPWQPPVAMPKVNPDVFKQFAIPNQWDDGSKGNYYSDFTRPSEGCVDNNHDGVSDNSHPIPGGAAVDRFPLMSPSSPPPAAVEKK